MLTVDGSHAQQTMPGGQADNHPFKVTVRTLAGHHMAETVKPDDMVAELTAKAVKHFVAKGELAGRACSARLPAYW